MKKNYEIHSLRISIFEGDDVVTYEGTTYTSLQEGEDDGGGDSGDFDQFW